MDERRRTLEEIVRDHEQWFVDMGIPLRTTTDDRQMFPIVMRTAFNGKEHKVRTEKGLVTLYGLIMIATQIAFHFWH